MSQFSETNEGFVVVPLVGIGWHVAEEDVDEEGSADFLLFDGNANSPVSKATFDGNGCRASASAAILLTGRLTEGHDWLGVCVGRKGGNGLRSLNEALREGDSDRKELWRDSDQRSRRVLVVQVVDFFDSGRL